MTIFADRIVERVTDTVAVGAVTSPFWLDTVSLVSQGATALLPVLGCLWLFVQMVTAWRQRKRIEVFVRKEGNDEGRKELQKEQLVDMVGKAQKDHDAV